MKSPIVILSLFISITVFASDAPRFKVYTQNGDVSLEQLSGKVVYLDFWASWCDPCRKSFPWMNEIQNQYADSGLVVLAVNLDREQEKADAFLVKNPTNFKVGFDPEGTLAKAFGVKGMPSSYVIGRNGELLYSHIGFREKDKGDLQSQIEQALTSK